MKKLRCIRRSDRHSYPTPFSAGLIVRDGQDIYPGEIRDGLFRSLVQVEVHCCEDRSLPMLKGGLNPSVRSVAHIVVTMFVNLAHELRSPACNSV